MMMKTRKGMKKLRKGFFSAMKDAVGSVGSSIASGVSSIGNSIADAAGDVGSSMLEGAKNMGAGAMSDFKSAGNAMMNGVNAAGNAISNGVNYAGNAIANGANAAGNAMVNGANSAANATGNALMSGAKGLFNGVKKIGGALLNGAASIFNGVIASIKSIYAYFTNFFKSPFYAEIRGLMLCTVKFVVNERNTTDAVKKMVANIEVMIKNWAGFITVIIGVICNWEQFKKSIHFLETATASADGVAKWQGFGRFVGEFLFTVARA